MLTDISSLEFLKLVLDILVIVAIPRSAIPDNLWILEYNINMMIIRIIINIINTSIITLKLVAIKTVELFSASIIQLVGMTVERPVVLVIADDIEEDNITDIEDEASTVVDVAVDVVVVCSSTNT